MQPDERIPGLLDDIVAAARAVAGFISNSDPDSFIENDLVRSAVERKIEIMGEAVRRLPVDFRNAHAEIPWRGVLSQRNFLAHEYDDVRIGVIWKVATVDIPDLLRQIETLRAELPT